jgi:hypothetical protein
LDHAAAELQIRTPAPQELLQQRRHCAQALGGRLDLGELSLGQPAPAVLPELGHELTNFREGEARVPRKLHHYDLLERAIVEDAAAGYLESRCCPFLDFGIGLRGKGGVVNLRLTGGKEVKAFLETEFPLLRAGAR